MNRNVYQMLIISTYQYQKNTKSIIYRDHEIFCEFNNQFYIILLNNLRFFQKPTSNPEENRKKAMYQLISKEQQYATGFQFAMTRFVSALAERKDLITPLEHRILFQNCEEVRKVAIYKSYFI